MMEVQSGDRLANSWVLAEHIVHEECKRIFGNESALTTAVGILADTDDTEFFHSPRITQNGIHCGWNQVASTPVSFSIFSSCVLQPIQ